MTSRRDTRDDRGSASPVSLYVHVPFCVLKCDYCDFHSTVLSATEPDMPEHFAWAVAEAASHWSELGVLDDVPSIYFGGGTPTTLGDGLVDAVRRLHEIARIRPDVEITVETNPDTTHVDLVLSLREAGVNRFSVGVQSFDDAVLRTLGRCHDAAAAERAVRDLVSTGARVSLDLMCGVPGQTSVSWRDTLERAMKCGAGHVSVYPLTVEDATPIARHIATARLDTPDPDLAAEMMLLADDVLTGAGFERYEIASYARPGERCAHNVGYWTGRSYLGLGPAASSMLPAETFRAVVKSESWPDPLVAGIGRVIEEVPHDAARVRFTRAADTVAFLRDASGAPEDIEFLTAEEAAREDVMLGLRLVEGVTVECAREAGVEGILENQRASGLVERSGAAYRLTRRGWLLGNEVFSAVWEGTEG